MKQSIKLIIAWLNGILWCYVLGWVFNWLFFKAPHGTGWTSSKVVYGWREEAVFPTFIILCGYIVVWIACIRKRLERDGLRDTFVKRLLFCYIYVICPIAGWAYLSAGVLL